MLERKSSSYNVSKNGQINYARDELHNQGIYNYLNNDILESAIIPSFESRSIDNEFNFDFNQKNNFLPSFKHELSTVVKWNQISVEVNAGSKSKKILDNISGEVNNLEMIAILGPSGKLILLK